MVRQIIVALLLVALVVGIAEIVVIRDMLLAFIGGLPL